MFKFQGKTYKIVADTSLAVSGCSECAFDKDAEKCADVDGPSTNREACCQVGVHYVEVPA